MCNIYALLTQSIVRETEQIPDENLTAEYVMSCMSYGLLLPPPPKRTSRA